MKRLSMAMTALAVLGLMTMVSCRKPNVNNVVPGAARTVTFNAATESGNGSKTYLEGLDVKWSADDQISVNGNDASRKLTLEDGVGTTFGRFTGTITATAPYLVGYPADATNNGSQITFTIPAPQDGDPDFDSKLPMAAYTTDENGDLSFKNMVNVLKLDLTGTQTITTIEVESADENLNGTFTVGASLTPTAISGSESTQKKITIGYPEGSPLDLNTNPTVYVVLPVFGSAESTVTIKFTGTDGVKTVGPKALKDSDKPNHRYEAAVAVSLVAPGCLPGDFRVASGRTVKFSKGNLWYGTASSKDAAAFHFESNQWGCQPSYSDEWADNNHISHFCWSKSSAEAVKQYYEETGTTVSDVFFTNTSETEGSFTVDGVSGWRTLSIEEWVYLLNSRTPATTSDNYKELTISGTPNTVIGLVLLPDGSGADLSAITDTDHLAEHGAVFLPAAGYRSGSFVSGFSWEGCYWSSTPRGVLEGGGDYAYHMYFDLDKVHTDNWGRGIGSAVRLVRSGS